MLFLLCFVILSDRYTVNLRSDHSSTARVPSAVSYECGDYVMAGGEQLEGTVSATGRLLPWVRVGASKRPVPSGTQMSTPTNEITLEQ